MVWLRCPRRETCVKRDGCVRRPQDTFETPCSERAATQAATLTPLRPCTRTCRGTRLFTTTPAPQSGGPSAAGHHAGQDRVVLVIVKPRRWRSDRAFRTALGLTMPARGARFRTCVMAGRYVVRWMSLTSASTAAILWLPRRCFDLHPLRIATSPAERVTDRQPRFSIARITPRSSVRRSPPIALIAPPELPHIAGTQHRGFRRHPLAGGSVADFDLHRSKS
jgi:hypothetical protein